MQISKFIRLNSSFEKMFYRSLDACEKRRENYILCWNIRVQLKFKKNKKTKKVLYQISISNRILYLVLPLLWLNMGTFQKCGFYGLLEIENNKNLKNPKYQFVRTKCKILRSLFYFTFKKIE